jgi:hypothetical protein
MKAVIRVAWAGVLVWSNNSPKLDLNLLMTSLVFKAGILRNICMEGGVLLRHRHLAILGRAVLLLGSRDAGSS